MATTNLFAGVLNKMEKAVLTSTKQALNRAGTSTRARYAKEISSSLGITSARAKSRAKIIKTGDTGVTLSIGVRTMFAAHDFKPKVIKVQSRLGTRYAATYQVKGQGRIQTTKGFVAYGKGSAKTIIIERKGAERYPTQTVMVNVFRPAVETVQPLLQQHMLDTFKKNLDSALTYNLDKI